MRAIIRFIIECLEALAEDDSTAKQRAREHQLAQRRWHDYLIS
jgi:hypothetical protein